MFEASQAGTWGGWVRKKETAGYISTLGFNPSVVRKRYRDRVAALQPDDLNFPRGQKVQGTENDAEARH